MRGLRKINGWPPAFAPREIDYSARHWGAGDLEASVKYRFYHDEGAGLQIAAFPGVTFTSSGACALPAVPS